MAPIISGNYLLVVYNEDTPETAVFTARLVIYEQLIYYRSNVKEASVVDERSYRQELDFDILYSNYEITRPYEDIHNVLLQNFNWHSKIDNLKPMFVKNNEMNYDYGEENTFSGLNEFRFLSIAGLNSINAKIKSLNINATDLVPEIELFPSESRRFKLYTTLPDINGDFKIDSQLGNDDDVESEYCRVKFSLPVDQELPKGNEIYVFGNLSFNSFLPEYKLAFNSETKSYEGTLLLKQGFYNFMYVLKYYDEIQTDYFEGEHFQTDNDFHIITYDSNPNIGYDRIIGFLETNTFNEN